MTRATLWLVFAACRPDPVDTSGSDADTDADSDADSDADLPAGAVLFREPFDDDAFTARGWFDGSDGEIVNTSHDGAGAFACVYEQGEQSCRGGKPARHAITPTESVYLSMWVQYTDGWVGSQRAYHPHEFHFTTNADSEWVGPANSRLTLYIEHVGGRPFLAMQDSRNVDGTCILRNDDSFVGCDGDFGSFAFTESRSAAACNGVVGDYDTRDCFDNGYWYSSKGWRSDEALTNGEWHFVEAYFRLNSVQNGVGIPDGSVRYALDGEVLIASDAVLLRTGALPDLRFDHFLMLPYIGDGSPVEQTVLYDELTVATGRP